MPNSSKMSGPVISETKQKAIQQLEQIIIITLKIEIRTMKTNSARREGDRRDKQIENNITLNIIVMQRGARA